MNASSSNVAKRPIIAFCLFIAIVLGVDIAAVQFNASVVSIVWLVITSLAQAAYWIVWWYLERYVSGG